MSPKTKVFCMYCIKMFFDARKFYAFNRIWTLKPHECPQTMCGLFKMDMDEVDQGAEMGEGYALRGLLFLRICFDEGGFLATDVGRDGWVYLLCVP